MRRSFHTRGEAQTQALGERLAARLRGGEVLLLQGDLGAGKTQLAKGIARGLGVRAELVSPTFTLVAQYDGRVPLSHYDLYRIESAADLEQIGYLQEDDPRTVCVVEWGERAELPAGSILVRFTWVGDDERRIDVDVDVEGRGVDLAGADLDEFVQDGEA